MMASYTRLRQTEKVVYRPSRSGLRPRTIDALVERPGMDPIQHGQATAIRITALNDELVGIPSDPRLSDVGRDRLDVAERRNGPPVSRSIHRFAGQDDPDFVTIEVQ